MKMFDNFDNMPLDYIPTNICKKRGKEDICIITGADCEQTFEINLDKDLISDIEVIYKYGVEVFTILSPESMNINENNVITKITVKLDSYDTAKLKSLLDFTVQLKLYLSDDTIIYGNPIKLKVIETLDN